METAKDFKNLARSCRHIASGTASPEIARVLVDMAKEFEVLAEQTLLIAPQSSGLGRAVFSPPPTAAAPHNL
jgi:hypothetical protein